MNSQLTIEQEILRLRSVFSFQKIRDETGRQVIVMNESRAKGSVPPIATTYQEIWGDVCGTRFDLFDESQDHQSMNIDAIKTVIEADQCESEKLCE
jgi:hypothetical protein